MKAFLKNLLLFFSALLVSLFLFESAFLVFLHHPRLARHLPGKLLHNIRIAYLNTRTVIQVEPAFSRFDPELGYTLKPGNFEFSNIEFKTDYFVNSLGLRDTEEALHKPDIIVLGDSYAMGWGVNQNEAFPQVLGRKTGRKVLNAAISSYGTAREMILLRRLDTSAMKYLIIQYYDNDHSENIVYFLNRNRLPPRLVAKRSRHSHDNYVAQRRYFFGKFTLCLISERIYHVWKSLKDEPEAKKEKAIVFSEKKISKIMELFRVPVDGDMFLQDFFDVNASLSDTLDNNAGIKEFLIEKDEADFFLNAILHSPVHLDNVRIIVLIMNSNDSLFARNLRKKVDYGKYPEYIKKMIIVDASPAFLKKDKFLLDDHLRASAHEKVADILRGVIGD